MLVTNVAYVSCWVELKTVGDFAVLVLVHALASLRVPLSNHTVVTTAKEVLAISAEVNISAGGSVAWN